jgi:archaellum biogenesis ATPase FlaH
MVTHPTPADHRYDVAMIEHTATTLLQTAPVLEIRIPNTPRQGTVSGYFDNLQAFTQAAREWSGKAPAVYTTLNPCTPALLARAKNRLKDRVKSTTSDNDIVQRRWLPLDFDPARPAEISSTDAEHDAALERAKACTAWLHNHGWPAPVAADSGNGAHRLYAIDLPNDSASRTLLQRCLEALALYFSDSSVALDLTVFNPARIWKVYGTMACKGDNLPERPHRLARLLDVPAPVEVVTRAQLEALAALVPEPPPGPARSGPQARAPFDLERWIQDHDIHVASHSPWQSGGTRWVLNPCPWNGGHTNGSAFIVQHANGAIAAGCHHNGCNGQDWHALRELYEPGWRAAGTHPQDLHQGRNGDTREPTARPQAEQATQEPLSFAPALVSFAELLTLDIPERKRYVEWLPERGIVMVYGPRGAGKTMLMLGLTIGLTTGTAFLKWPVHHQTGVLYVDGEMPIVELRGRTVTLAHEAIPQDLHFLTGELVYEKLGVDLILTSEAARTAIEAILTAHPTIRVVILDNISCLFSGISEDKKQDWEPINTWLVRLRHRGITVVLVHHAGKGGQQRGTSGREDSLDAVLALEYPEDYRPEEGCHFHLRFQKARSIKGDAVTALDVRLEDLPDGPTWTFRPLEESSRERIKQMLDDGMSPAEIATELGISRSYVYRIKRGTAETQEDEL